MRRLPKINKYYIYFDASCDYTGFHCRGGGTFAYNKDWKQLWNMNMTQSYRNIIMVVNRYTKVNDNSYEGKEDFIYHIDKEHIKLKLNLI